MGFNYVWATVETIKNPPCGKDFHAENKIHADYEFYPFPFDKTVFTIDLDVWSINQKYLSDKNSPITYWPSYEKLSSFLNQYVDSKYVKFLILCEQPEASTIDPNHQVTLINVNDVGKEIKNYIFLGFDVIDISGLSAMVNIGYSHTETIEIGNAHIGINKFGLIQTLQDSFKFSEMASLFAIEHAPFFPVEVHLFQPDNEPRTAGKNTTRDGVCTPSLTFY